MNSTERELRRRILILEETIKSWYPWHCHDYFCEHHTCRVRSQKLNDLRYSLRGNYIRWKIIREQKRTQIFLRI